MSAEPAAKRLRIGAVPIDVVTFQQALDAIERLVARGEGGAVFTPNTDHVVNAEDQAAFKQAYAEVDLSLVDGKPLLWAARLLGEPLPAKISGSDLVGPLMALAAARRWRVYLLGAGPGVAEKAAEVLRERGVDIVGTASPFVSKEGVPDSPEVLAHVRAARPDLLLVAFGSPKQELFIHRSRAELGSAVALGIGASLDFIAGTLKRAPQWMSDAGLEWLYRLSQEPKRLWRRYLVNDPKLALILARQLREAQKTRPARS